MKTQSDKKPANYKDVKAYTLAAWLLATSTIIAALVGIGFGLCLAGDIFNSTDGFGLIVFLFFVAPFIGLTVMNAALLKGVLNKKVAAIFVAMLVLPIEWGIGLVLGGDSIGSGLFDKQIITTLPHHHLWVSMVLLLFVGLSIYAFGKDLAVAQKSKNKA